MKRFMLFAYSDYYPSGGMNDFLGSFDTLRELGRYIGQEVSTSDNIQIYDLERDFKTYLYNDLLMNIDNYMKDNTKEYLDKGVFHAPRCENCFHNDPQYNAVNVYEGKIILKCVHCGYESEKD